MTVATPLQPIVNAGLLYANNCQLGYVGNTTLTVAAGQMRDSTNTNDIILSTGVTINSAVNGLNGLDIGTFAASTGYNVWLIGSSGSLQPTGAVLSLDTNTTPYLPLNYDMYRRIGWIKTDGSTHILKWFNYGNDNVRYYFWDAVVTALNAQGNTSYTVAQLTHFMSPNSQLAILNWEFVPQTAGNAAQLRPTGSSSTTNIQLFGSVAAKPNSGQIIMNTSALQVVDYATTSASDQLSLFIQGWIDFI